MPCPYLLTPRAIDDLDEIWNYIAQDSPAAADRVEGAIFEAFSSLARHPMLGSKRSEISSLPVRFWVLSRYPSYVVVYRPDTKPLRIVAVLHAKRNLKTQLANREIL